MALDAVVISTVNSLFLDEVFLVCFSWVCSAEIALQTVEGIWL